MNKMPSDSSKSESKPTRRGGKVSAIAGYRRQPPGGGPPADDPPRPPRVVRARDTVSELDKVAQRVIKRLLAPTAEEMNAPTVGEGRRKRTIYPAFLPARANAIAIMGRLRLDLHSQFLAGEELRRLRSQLEELMPVIRAVREERGV